MLIRAFLLYSRQITMATQRSEREQRNIEGIRVVVAAMQENYNIDLADLETPEGVVSVREQQIRDRIAQYPDEEGWLRRGDSKAERREHITELRDICMYAEALLYLIHVGEMREVKRMMAFGVHSYSFFWKARELAVVLPMCDIIGVAPEELEMGELYEMPKRFGLKSYETELKTLGARTRFTLFCQNQAERYNVGDRHACTAYQLAAFDDEQQRAA